MHSMPMNASRRSSCFLRAAWWLLAAAAALPTVVLADGFAVFLSPSRFELRAAPGETVRQVLEFHHVGTEPGRYRVYTNEWSLKDDDSVQFGDTLAPDSCRPWVALESREISVVSNGRYRFRFEISTPANTPARECRFALMVEGLDTAKFERENLNFPVAGRIGVIVYVKVGDAEAKLAMRSAGVKAREGERYPALEVTNTGNATGRIEGFLTGRDAKGTAFDLGPESLPILPGRSRVILLQPVYEDGRKPPAIQYPLTVKGNIEWGKNREPVDLRFEP
jgi:hypothetical protein